MYYKLHAHLPRRFGQLEPRRYLEVYIEKLMEVDKPSLFEVRKLQIASTLEFLASSKFLFCHYRCYYYHRFLITIINPRTYKGRGFSQGFSDFFVDDKISAPEVFCNSSLIPRANFETSLAMVMTKGEISYIP